MGEHDSSETRVVPLMECIGTDAGKLKKIVVLRHVG
jgi:hypothetical protein